MMTKEEKILRFQRRAPLAFQILIIAHTKKDCENRHRCAAPNVRARGGRGHEGPVERETAD